MALEFREKTNGNHPLPEIFKGKKFRSYIDMAYFADQHRLPAGEYFIRNTNGRNLATALRELKRKSDNSGFWVEGRGNV